MKLIVVCVLLSVLALAASKKTGPSHKKHVVCNVPTKSLRKQQNNPFELKNADLNLCTHLVTVDPVTIEDSDSWDAPAENELEDWTKMVEGDYAELVDLWNYTYPHLNIFLGSRHSASEYLKIATSPNRHQEFILKSHDFLVKYDLNGLNLDISNLEEDKISTAGLTQIVSFIGALSEKLSRSNLDLSVTIEYTKDLSVEKYNFTQLSQYVDFISFVQLYAPDNSEKPTFNDVLKGRNIANIQEKLEQIIASGVQPEKVVMGIPFYGPIFTGVPLQSTDYEKAKFKGIKTYKEICALRSNANEEAYTIDGSGLAVLKVDIAKQVQTIVFESSRTIANEVRLAMKHAIAGIQGNIEQDDYHGLCQPDTDTFADYQDTKAELTYPNRTSPIFPLLRTINEAIVVSLQEIYLTSGATYFATNVQFMIFSIVAVLFSKIIIA